MDTTVGERGVTGEDRIQTNRALVSVDGPAASGGGTAGPEPLVSHTARRDIIDWLTIGQVTQILDEASVDLAGLTELIPLALAGRTWWSGRWLRWAVVILPQWIGRPTRQHPRTPPSGSSGDGDVLGDGFGAGVEVQRE